MPPGHRPPLAPISVNCYPPDPSTIYKPPNSAQATPHRAVPGWPPAASQEGSVDAWKGWAHASAFGRQSAASEQAGKPADETLQSSQPLQQQELQRQTHVLASNRQQDFLIGQQQLDGQAASAAAGHAERASDCSSQVAHETRFRKQPGSASAGRQGPMEDSSADWEADSRHLKSESASCNIIQVGRFTP